MEAISENRSCLQFEKLNFYPEHDVQRFPLYVRLIGEAVWIYVNNFKCEVAEDYWLTIRFHDTFSAPDLVTTVSTDA